MKFSDNLNQKVRPESALQGQGSMLLLLNLYDVLTGMDFNQSTTLALPTYHLLLKVKLNISLPI